MDSNATNKLIQCLSLDAVDMVDALSSLGALAEIRTDGQSEDELLQSALSVLLDSRKIERAAVFLMQDKHYSLRATACWNMADIVTTLSEPGRYVIRPGQGQVGETIKTATLVYEPTIACPEYHSVRRWAAGQGALGVPTIIVFRGGRRLGRILGVLPEEALRERIREFAPR